MNYLSRIKRVDLLASVGAGVLGAGLGATFPTAFTSIGVALIILGGTMHALGMWQRHRLDLEAEAALPRWSSILYWGCWLALAILGGNLLVG